ncbi:MAG TPA: cytochrome c oxidase accessory protein CcoG [Limnobacter sp.]|nr:cytochrome c oxidase accessory protein CcoG [Limnobacter sp.]
MFQTEQKVVPRSVWGKFARTRWVMVWFTQLLYYGTAWLQYNGRQALLFDLEARRFYLGPLVFYPQDFIYLTGLLVIAALSLFLFTAVAGRLWCGYACPQTVYTEIFMWFERKIEGDRNDRLRRAAGSWTLDRTGRAVAKNAVWLLFAAWTGLTFVGYFTPIRELTDAALQFSLGPWEMFWIVFYSAATFGNAGFMREQVCKYMCPYARFQSAMFDKDTLLVTYDQARGEPRGSRSRKADPQSLGLGACVDCNLCVQVCPTGIDIRKGLQYECIGCAACVDVCDQVMDKMNYPRGLVKYSTQNGLLGQWSVAQMWRRAFRPRVLVYTAVVWGLIVAMAIAIAVRHDLRVDVLRDRGVNFRLAEDGVIENVYRLNLMNASEHPLQVSVALKPLASGMRVMETQHLVVKSTESRWVVIHVQADPEAVRPGSNTIVFEIHSTRQPVSSIQQATGHDVIEESAVFLAPR